MVVECPPDASTVQLAHCCGGLDLPLFYEIRAGFRERLAAGEMVPVSVRCRRCDGRAFASLVDPAARARRLAEAPREASPRVERVRRFAAPAAVRPPLRIAGDPCPACGVMPDQFGLCRCSA